MSRLNIYLILLLTGLLAFGTIQNASASNSSATDSVAKAPIVLSPTATPTPTLTPVGQPLSIEIPKMQVNASVVPVGTDFQGKMSMPGDWDKTAWYSGEGSFKPGEKGNAVIAGHLDTIYGTLGQFYNLNMLVTGDMVTVRDELNQVHNFIVTDKETYAFDQAPLTEIFGPSSEKHLNLITCTGWYNPVQHNYDHRLVVYTKLVE